MIEVVCGIIYNDDKVFIARRRQEKSLAGKWEFPGGKIDKNESEQNALVRELTEEFGMSVQVNSKIGEHLHQYPDFTIKLIAYKCEFKDASFVLTDHDDYKWVFKEEILEYDLADADKPFVKMI